MLYEFFFDLSANRIDWIIWKILAFIGLSLLSAFVIHGILIRATTLHAEETFPLRYKILMLHSILGAVILLNILWFCTVWLNDEHHFNWGSFKFERSNIYWLLSPIIISHLVLIGFYSWVRSSILKVF